MAMCEHMRARKLRLREFPARYAFRPLPCDDCDYVMQLPDLYMYAPSVVFCAIIIPLVYLYGAWAATLDLNPGQRWGIAAAALMLLAYLYAKFVGYWMYSLAWDIRIYDE